MSIIHINRASRRDLEEVAGALKGVNPEAHSILDAVLKTWCTLEPGRHIPAAAFTDGAGQPVLVDAFLPKGARRFTQETWARASTCERMHGVAHWKRVVSFRDVRRHLCSQCGQEHEVFDWTGPDGGGWTRKTLVLCIRRRIWRVHPIAPPVRFSEYDLLKKSLYPEA